VPATAGGQPRMPVGVGLVGCPDLFAEKVGEIYSAAELFVMKA
jgi:hypothetical protein